MNTHTVIYHSADLDGFCSGAVVKFHLLRSGVKEEEIDLIGWNYGDPIPYLAPEAQVFMTDISFPIKDMQDIKERCFLTWIDHHKSAIADSIAGGYNNVPGMRYVGDSASRIAWRFFNGDDAPRPDVVYWVDRYDVWKKDGEYSWNEVMCAQHGMRARLSNPENTENYSEWEFALSSNQRMFEIIQVGRIIYESEKKTNVFRCSKAFDLEFEGIKFAALNNTLAGSAVLDSYARPDHDALLVFSFHGKRQEWDVSLYKNDKSTQEIDLSEVAKRYGGGGHASASGFRIANILDVLNYQNNQ